MVAVVISKDVEGTPLKKGQEITLDSQTASLLVNVEKVATYKEKAKKEVKTEK